MLTIIYKSQSIKFKEICPLYLRKIKSLAHGQSPELLSTLNVKCTKNTNSSTKLFIPGSFPTHTSHSIFVYHQHYSLFISLCLYVRGVLERARVSIWVWECLCCYIFSPFNICCVPQYTFMHIRVDLILKYLSKINLNSIRDLAQCWTSFSF